MNDKKYILNIGLNDKDTKTQIIKTTEAKKIIQNILFINDVNGYTIYDGYGLYKHDDGAITKEKTIIIELLYINDDTIQKIIAMLKTALNQESILKQTFVLNISFE